MKSIKELEEIAETIYNIEINISDKNKKSAIKKIERIIRSLSLEELLEIDDLVMQKFKSNKEE
jgi:hypothetical protein